MNEDPFAALGLSEGATVNEVRARFRELALRHHPDRGGEDETMVVLLRAYRQALARSTGETSAGPPPNRPGRVRRDPRARRERDVASFTVDSLPVDAYEGVRLAAAALGDIADEEPPYALEFVVRNDEVLWCRCELFPDAGSTTVALAVAPAGEEPLVRVDAMRDLLVAEINSLDW